LLGHRNLVNLFLSRDDARRGAMLYPAQSGRSAKAGTE